MSVFALERASGQGHVGIVGTLKAITASSVTTKSTGRAELHQHAGTKFRAMRRAMTDRTSMAASIRDEIIDDRRGVNT